MPEDYEQIETEQEIPQSPEELLLLGALGVVKNAKSETYRVQKQLDAFVAKQKSLPQGSIVAEGKQNELLAILNIVHTLFVGDACTKAEFMHRMALAFGAPGLEKYAANLHNILTTNKYADIFEEFKKEGLAAKEQMEKRAS